SGTLLCMRIIDSPALDRLLDPLSRCLTPDVARNIIKLRADPELQAEIDQLADKCTAGTLTPMERTRYETYVAAIDFLAVLQSKARALLANVADKIVASRGRQPPEEGVSSGG